ncbi:MAG: PAS domain-containing protein [Deltaproteobacteria bacterium]|nr:PAS domain-containing protein [Deltaproteobacteria bacterium]
MANKPTYEELEQRVKDLEKEAVDREPQESESTKMQHIALEILKAIPGTLNVVDKHYNILAIGGEIARKIGDTSRIIGEKCYKVFQEKNIPCSWCRVGRVIETGEIVDETTNPDCHREKSVKKPLSVYVRPLKDKHGNIIGAIELGTDISQIRKAEQERKLVEEALQKSEERFRTMFESAQDCIFIKDKALRYTHVNPAMETLFGLSSSELVAKTDGEFFGEEAASHIKEVDFRVLEGETVEENDTKPIGGIPTTFHIVKVPMRDSSGKITGLSGIARDITNRKRTEEQLRQSLKEKEVLLAEIHHRVKNNFQVISSLLDLIGMRTQNQEAIDLLSVVRSKIYSIALVHEQLYNENRFDKIHMVNHLRKLVKYIQDNSVKGVSINTEIHPSDVLLAVNQAIPCALILNEVLSNSFKHAFKQRQQGTIEITILETADDMVIISVKDDGIGIPEYIDIEKTTTLGLKLVNRLVHSQLKGKMQVYRNNGTKVTIEFKAVSGGAGYA